MAAGVTTLHGESNYRYRKFKSDAMMAVTVGATIVTLIPLFLVLGYLLTKGSRASTGRSSRICRRRSAKRAAGWPMRSSARSKWWVSRA